MLTVPCVSPQNHQGVCPQESVYCENKCGARMMRRLLSQHSMAECPKRTQPCKYCGKEFVYDTIQVGFPSQASLPPARHVPNRPSLSRLCHYISARWNSSSCYEQFSQKLCLAESFCDFIASTSGSRTFVRSAVLWLSGFFFFPCVSSHTWPEPSLSLTLCPHHVPVM